jgi:histidinol phosphatase-like PHP family hydrolase
MNDERVTLGEVYRLCERIEEKVDKTNGRVSALETDAIRIKTVWSVGAAVAIFLGDTIKHKLGL